MALTWFYHCPSHLCFCFPFPALISCSLIVIVSKGLTALPSGCGWRKPAALQLVSLQSLNLQCQVHTVAPPHQVSAGQFLSYFQWSSPTFSLFIPSGWWTLRPISRRRKNQVEENCPHSAALLPVSPTCCQFPAVFLILGGSVCFDLELTLSFVCHLLLLFLPFKGLHSLSCIIFFLCH